MTTKTRNKPRTVRDTVVRTLQLVQRSNSWCSGADLSQDRDSQGKLRSQFCLRGAVRAALGGNTTSAMNSDLNQSKLYKRTQASILKTINSNPERYGVMDEYNYGYSLTQGSLVHYNDEFASHANVVKALKDTVTRLSTR